jgi:hypothetical protein
MGYITVKVSLEDYEKIKNLDEVSEEEIAVCKDVKGLLLQTSSTDRILFTCQPERSKREDPHLNIRDIPDDISADQLKDIMLEVESRILGCGALNFSES